MTDEISIKIIIPQSLKDKLNPSNFEKVVSDGVTAAANELKADASIYPGQSHKPVIWASEKQRRYYFAMRGEAGLPAQYTRQSDSMSQRMAKSWVVTPVSFHQTNVIQSATYAEYVIGAKQQPQHKATGWRTVDAIAAAFQASGKLQKVFSKVISAFIKE